MKTHEQVTNYYRRERASAQRYLNFLEEHKDKLKRLRTMPSFWGSDHCDFDSLTHPQCLEVIKAFPGKWDKAPGYNNEGITYTLREKVGKFIVRVYNCEPPPFCKIEETVEYKVVPEHTERVVKRKVICPEKVEAQIGPEL